MIGFIAALWVLWRAWRDRRREPEWITPVFLSSWVDTGGAVATDWVNLGGSALVEPPPPTTHMGWSSFNVRSR